MVRSILLMTAAFYCGFCFAPSTALASPATRAALDAKATQFWAHQGYHLKPVGHVGHTYNSHTAVVAWATLGGDDVNLNMPNWHWQTWPMKCTIWIHERGHNLGLGHSTTGIMRPTIYAPTKACRGWSP